MPDWLQRICRVIVFPFIGWANGPRMLQLEIRRPRLYRALVWPPFLALSIAVALLTLWLQGVVSF
jgi:hypothetical protein